MNGDLCEKLPVKRHLQNIRKMMTVLWKLDVWQFPMAVLAVVTGTVQNYLLLLLPAWTLNRLAQGAGWGQLVRPVAAFLAAVWFCQAAQRQLWGLVEVKRGLVASRFRLVQSQKLMQMDFSLLDSPRLLQIQEKIRKDNEWGSGIFTIFWNFDWMARGIFGLAGALALAAPVLPAVRSSGPRAVWILPVLYLAGLAAFIRTKLRLERKGNEVLMREKTEEEMAQKQSFVYGFAQQKGFSYQNGKDVRLYDGYGLFDEYTIRRLQGPRREEDTGIGRILGKNSFIRSSGDHFFRIFPYFWVAYVALPGVLQAGSVLQYAEALSRLVGAVSDIAMAAGQISLACRRQLSILELLELEDEMYKGKLPVEKRSDYAYEIEFSHVWFQYPGASDYALRDFSLKLSVGEKLAIVGRNGSGKTTMIKLLCRLYEPQRGEIRLNGVDIRKFRADEYRRLFSVVFQDLYLYPLPLGENVAGTMDYPEEKVLKCLQDAGLGERLARLPDGLATFLYKDYDDGGIEVSGGEAQKIAIARALCKDAPFILLDEPTAALDPKAEYEVYSRFDRMVGEKTAIYISHRLSSCRFCDDIAVFSEGRLVQRGSHEELLADRKGQYAQLWNAQAQYYNTSE